MIRRRSAHKVPTHSSTTGLRNFHDWVVSLPWVVERPYDLGTPDARSFAVDCEPLDRKQLWLITGFQQPSCVDDIQMAVIVPIEVAPAIEAAGWGKCLAPMPAGSVLMAAAGDAATRPRAIEALALAAYSCVFSS